MGHCASVEVLVHGVPALEMGAYVLWSVGPTEGMGMIIHW